MERRTPKLYRRNNNRRPDEFRADRVLANRSGKPRSECFELLRQRRVYYRDVDNNDSDNNEVGFDAMNDCVRSSSLWKPVPGPKHRIGMSVPLCVDSVVVPLPPPLLMAYHKPKWMLSVRSDPRRDRPCLSAETLIRSGIPEPFVTSPPSSSSSSLLHPVGRLDYDSSGLLLLSSDGTLTQRLLHPRHNITKEYVAVVSGRVNPGDLAEQLRRGVTTSEGVHTGVLVKCRHWDDDDASGSPSVRQYLQSVRDGLPPEYNCTDLASRGYLDVLVSSTELSTVTLMVSEGKHRMVRRMLANCGHPVVDLKRNRVGSIELGSLDPGRARYLTKQELAWAQSLLRER
jgi:23S rRNA pseudouridine2605 synthase